jgi:hypothetical protein
MSTTTRQCSCRLRQTTERGREPVGNARDKAPRDLCAPRTRRGCVHHCLPNARAQTVPELEAPPDQAGDAPARESALQIAIADVLATPCYMNPPPELRATVSESWWSPGSDSEHFVCSSARVEERMAGRPLTVSIVSSVDDTPTEPSRIRCRDGRSYTWAGYASSGRWAADSWRERCSCHHGGPSRSRVLGWRR